MEIYENENDQVEAVKRFFAENGKALAVGVILGVGALIGWRYWNSHQVDSARSRFSCLSKCGYRSERRQTG
ncbi:conserved protein, UPF0070 family [Escherichia coli]|uniref:Conserved protein, UPF0070 family n=1 Tax=Escherichia coli TaxID=562 RepID=A0A376SBW5_ECOLX|nr:conserved protein, UPF0070 family [Escherichia coli]